MPLLEGCSFADEDDDEAVDHIAKRLEEEDLLEAEREIKSKQKATTAMEDRIMAKLEEIVSRMTKLESAVEEIRGSMRGVGAPEEDQVDDKKVVTSDESDGEKEDKKEVKDTLQFHVSNMDANYNFHA